MSKKFFLTVFHSLATAGQALIFFVVLSVVFSSGSSNLAWEDFAQPSQDPQKQETPIPLPNDWFTLSFTAILSISAAILSSQILPVGAVKVSENLFAFLESQDDSKRKEKIRQMQEKIKQMNQDFKQRQKELLRDIEDKKRLEFEREKEKLQQKFEDEKEKAGKEKERILKESFNDKIGALKRAIDAEAEKKFIKERTKLMKNFESDKEALRTTVTGEVANKKEKEFESRKERYRLQVVPTLQNRQLKNIEAKQKELADSISRVSEDVQEDAKNIVLKDD